MTTIVTIKTNTRVAVISERIVDDGRERHQNGTDVIEAGAQMDFIVHATQSLRVVELDPEPEAPQAPESAQEPEQQPT